MFLINLVLAILKSNLDSGNLIKVKAESETNSPRHEVTGTVRKVSENFKTKEISADTTFIAKARRKLHVLVETNHWTIFFIILVLLNTIVLACQYADMPDDEQATLASINAVLTHIFAVEVCLKIIAFGVKPYFLEGMNLFDFFVVAMSYVESAVAGGGSSLTALRSLRILRIFRIIRIFKMLNFTWN